MGLGLISGIGVEVIFIVFVIVFYWSFYKVEWFFENFIDEGW